MKKTLKELDDITFGLITNLSNIPEENIKVLQSTRIDKKNQVYELLFPKNVGVKQNIHEKDRANFKGNTYTPNKPAPTNMVSVMIKQAKDTVKRMKNSPTFVLEQVLLHLLNPKESKIWNPAGLPLSLVPLVGGGNIPNVLSLHTFLGPVQYWRLKDQNKKTYEQVFNNNNPLNKNILSRKNKDSNPKFDKEQYPKDTGYTYSLNANKRLVINTGMGYDVGEPGITQRSGEVTFDIDQYIQDTEYNLLSPSYTKLKYYPSTPVEDIFDEESNRLIRQFYFESNINRGRTTNEPGGIDTLLQDKVMTFYGGFVDEDISESYRANWSGDSYVGSSQQLYKYGNTNRSLSLNCILVAEQRDPLNIEKLDLNNYINKINWLVQHCYPDYIGDNINKAPTLKLTLGKLFVKLPVILESLEIVWKQPWDISEDVMFPMIATLNMSFQVLGVNNNGKIVTPSSNDVYYSIGQGT